MKKFKKIFIGIIVTFAVAFCSIFIAAFVDVVKNPDKYNTTEAVTPEKFEETSLLTESSSQKVITTLIEESVTLIDNKSTTTTTSVSTTKAQTTTEPIQQSTTKQTTTKAVTTNAKVDLNKIPAFYNKPYVTVNNNQPGFTDADKTIISFEKYTSLDSKGRCGVAYACIGKDLMPTNERGNIGSIKPTGWHTVKYAGIDGNYLYNRCHLIGWQLTGENTNEKNLITGTRYMNVEGMLPFENMVADYIKETENHVLYRVTPIFKGNNLLASGVQIEAYSVEDNGDGICFNVFCYNSQPNITINYTDGSSFGPPMEQTTKKPTTTQSTTITMTQKQVSSNVKYILNINPSSMKFHYPNCSSVDKMKEENKKEFYGSRQEAINAGYSPCGNCHP